MFLYFPGSGHIVESRDLFTVKKLFFKLWLNKRMAFGVLSKGDIVYYISYLGQKPERNDFTGNDGGGDGASVNIFL